MTKKLRLCQQYLDHENEIFTSHLFFSLSWIVTTRMCVAYLSHHFLFHCTQMDWFTIHPGFILDLLTAAWTSCALSFYWKSIRHNVIEHAKNMINSMASRRTFGAMFKLHSNFAATEYGPLQAFSVLSQRKHPIGVQHILAWQLLCLRLQEISQICGGSPVYHTNEPAPLNSIYTSCCLRKAAT